MRFPVPGVVVIVAIVLSGCHSEDSAWKDAANRADEQSLHEFLKLYPAGDHAEEAKKRVVAFHACRAVGGGDVAFARDPKAGYGSVALHGDETLAGVIVECQAGSGGITLHINEKTTYAVRPGSDSHRPWSAFQPIDADDVKMTISELDAAYKTWIQDFDVLKSPYGGTVMDQHDEHKQLVDTLSRGWIKDIGGVRDRSNKGEPMDFYGWALVAVTSTPSELTVKVPPSKRCKFALLFSGSRKEMGDVFLDGTDLYYEGRT